jgi:hypothetical protein
VSRAAAIRPRFNAAGSCVAVPRINRPAPAQAARALKDYCLVDEQRKRLGTITAARVKPVLGKNAPTLLLNREWGK